MARGFGLGGVGDVGGRYHDIEGRDGGGQDHAVLIVVELDGGREDALDADAIGAHDGRDFLAIGVEHAQAHGFGILVAELEDVADFEGFADLDEAAAARADVARGHLPQVADFGLEILAGGDVAKVVVVAVGAGDHVAAAGEGLIGEDGHAGHAHGAERAGIGAEPFADLGGVGRAELGVAGDGGELGLAELVVAAQQHQDRLTVGHQHEALHLRGGGEAGEFGDFGDGLAARRMERLRGEVARGIGDGGRRGTRGGLLEIGGVAADGADGDEVLAGLGRHHEFLRLAAAHRAGVSFDHLVGEAAALEDAAVGAAVLLVGAIETGLVEIERVGVLHEELAHAQQAALGAGLVAELGLDLIPDLRKLLVAAELAAGDRGHDFLVGHAEAKLALEAVAQAEHGVAHGVPAAGFLPEFGGVEGREVDLLRADGIHLFAHDLLDLEQRPLGEKQVAVDASGELADVARAQQKLMARELGLGRSFAQGRDEEIGPEHQTIRRVLTAESQRAQRFRRGSSNFSAKAPCSLRLCGEK